MLLLDATEASCGMVSVTGANVDMLELGFFVNGYLSEARAYILFFI